MQVFGEVGRWFSEQPPCSRWLLLFSLSLPLLLQLGLLPVSWLVYYTRLIVRGQVWRCFTSLFLAKPSLPFLFNVFFRFQYASQLEVAQFARSKGDFAYFLIWTGLLLNVVNGPLGLATLWDSYSMVIAYVWSRYYREAIVSFLFGIKFKVHLELALTHIGPLLAIGDVGNGFGDGGIGYRGIVGSDCGALVLLSPGRLASWPESMLTESSKPKTGQHGFGARIPDVQLNREKPDESLKEVKPFSGSGRKLGS